VIIVQEHGGVLISLRIVISYTAANSYDKMQ